MSNEVRDMPVQIPKEKWTGKIKEVKFGATQE
jgi:hypothetical protein